MLHQVICGSGVFAGLDRNHPLLEVLCTGRTPGVFRGVDSVVASRVLSESQTT